MHEDRFHGGGGGLPGWMDGAASPAVRDAGEAVTAAARGPMMALNTPAPVGAMGGTEAVPPPTAERSRRAGASAAVFSFTAPGPAVEAVAEAPAAAGAGSPAAGTPAAPARAVPEGAPGVAPVGGWAGDGGRNGGAAASAPGAGGAVADSAGAAAPSAGAAAPLCATCRKAHAQIKRPSTRQPSCKTCFFAAFEAEVDQFIRRTKMFAPADRVVVGVSGGKDSTVLAHLLHLLNGRHGYDIDLFLVAVDEGIAGYRDDSLRTVRGNEKSFSLPLVIVSYRALFGWTMDEITRQTGAASNCTFCGVLRRRALDLACMRLGANKLATGHNLDDAAETALMNVLRGDVGRMGRRPQLEAQPLPGAELSKPAHPNIAGTHERLDENSARIDRQPHVTSSLRETSENTMTNTEGCSARTADPPIHLHEGRPLEARSSHGTPWQPRRAPPIRVKPLARAFEKEIVMYAHFKRLDYFSTECLYSGSAFRGGPRHFVKSLERADPAYLPALCAAAEELQRLFASRPAASLDERRCASCQFPSSSDRCKVCVILAGLNQQQALAALGRKQREIRVDAGPSRGWGNGATVPFDYSTAIVGCQGRCA